MAGPEFPKDQFPYGICPLISRLEYQQSGSVLLPAASVAGRPVMSVNAPGVAIPLFCPCVGKNCCCWDSGRSLCGLVPVDPLT